MTAKRRSPAARIARALHIPQRVFFMTARIVGALFGFGFRPTTV